MYKELLKFPVRSSLYIFLLCRDAEPARKERKKETYKSVAFHHFVEISQLSRLTNYMISLLVIQESICSFRFAEDLKHGSKKFKLAAKISGHDLQRVP